MTAPRVPKVRIYHNNLWARYKGAIFSKVYSNSGGSGIATSFVQFAETEPERARLGVVDVSYHHYPYRLLFTGNYEDVPLYRLVTAATGDVLRNPCDLVVMPGYHRIEYWAMLMLCIVLRRKRAVFCDSTANDRGKYWWKEMAKAFFFRHCHGFFCYGIRSKEYVESFGVNEHKIYYRCQAAALPRGYDASAILGYYEKNGADAATISKFLYIGRLSVEKGLFDLLDAFRYVRDQTPEAKLDIVGSGLVEGELVARAKELGLGSAVSFLGSKTPEDIGQLLVRSTALILPSHREPWGLVVNEALSYGCPVVVSSICGCVPELVLDGLTGYSFPVGNSRALCEAMIAASRMSIDRLSAAKNCLDLIAQYTPERAASEILNGCITILETP
jgi:glycosyltransferase involved in cell wall biosynthesis